MLQCTHNGHFSVEIDMDKLSKQKLIKTISLIANALKNQDQGDRNALVAYIDQLKTAPLDEAFFLTPLDSSDDFKQPIKELLDAAKISHEQQGRYKNASITLYDLLVELHEQYKKLHKNNLQNELDKVIIETDLKDLIEILDIKYKSRYEKIVLGGLLFLLGIVGAEPFGGFTVLQQILTATLFIPVVQLVAAAGVGLYTLYQTTFNKSLPLFNKIRDNFFILASTGLKVSAYSFLVVAACTASPLVSFLTVAGQGVTVIHEFFKLMQMKYQGKKRIHDAGEMTLEKKQEQARFDNLYEKQKKSVWIAFITALVMTLLVAASCFIPGGIFVSIGATLLIGVTYFVQWKATKSVEKQASKDLAAKFEALEAEDRQQRPEVVNHLDFDAGLDSQVSPTLSSNLSANNNDGHHAEARSESLPQSPSGIDVAVNFEAAPKPKDSQGRPDPVNHLDFDAGLSEQQVRTQLSDGISDEKDDGYRTGAPSPERPPHSPPSDKDFVSKFGALKTKNRQLMSEALLNAGSGEESESKLSDAVSDQKDDGYQADTPSSGGGRLH